MRHEAGLAILTFLLGLASFAVWAKLRERQRRRRAARLGMRIDLTRSGRD
jgi:hypothetical protein